MGENYPGPICNIAWTATRQSVQPKPPVLAGRPAARTLLTDNIHHKITSYNQRSTSAHISEPVERATSETPTIKVCYFFLNCGYICAATKRSSEVCDYFTRCIDLVRCVAYCCDSLSHVYTHHIWTYATAIDIVSCE